MLVRFPRRPPSGPAPARNAGATLEELVRLGHVGAGEAILRLEAQWAAAAARHGGPEPAQAQCPQNDHRLREIMAELDSLVGLECVKAMVREIRAYVSIQQRRRMVGLGAEPLVLHMIFRGNPGTGKTTVARILGRMFGEMGVLSKGHLVEVERADLVGEYIGHTAQKTKEQLKRAEGGILFIDEAYALARGGEKDFGKEAIDTLVKAMEDLKDRLVLVLAGYRHEMSRFLESNPGLRSRFPIHIEFPDFTLDELLSIAQGMVRERDYRLAPEAEAALREAIDAKLDEGTRNAGNARLVRNLIEAALRRQALRLVDCADLDRDALMTISPEDFGAP